MGSRSGSGFGLGLLGLGLGAGLGIRDVNTPMAPWADFSGTGLRLGLDGAVSRAAERHAHLTMVLTCLQARHRSRRQRVLYLSMLSAVLSIQTVCRARRARGERYKRLALRNMALHVVKVKRVQWWVRFAVCRMRYLKHRHSVITLQANFRRRRSRAVSDKRRRARDLVAAYCLGWTVRVRGQRDLRARVARCGRQCVVLWAVAGTPLRYRANFLECFLVERAGVGSGVRVQGKSKLGVGAGVRAGAASFLVLAIVAAEMRRLHALLGLGPGFGPGLSTPTHTSAPTTSSRPNTTPIPIPTPTHSPTPTPRHALSLSAAVLDAQYAAAEGSALVRCLVSAVSHKSTAGAAGAAGAAAVRSRSQSNNTSNSSTGGGGGGGIDSNSPPLSSPTQSASTLPQPQLHLLTLTQLAHADGTLSAAAAALVSQARQALVLERRGLYARLGCLPETQRVALYGLMGMDPGGKRRKERLCGGVFEGLVLDLGGGGGGRGGVGAAIHPKLNPNPNPNPNPGVGAAILGSHAHLSAKVVSAINGYFWSESGEYDAAGAGGGLGVVSGGMGGIVRRGLLGKSRGGGGERDRFVGLGLVVEGRDEWRGKVVGEVVRAAQAYLVRALVRRGEMERGQTARQEDKR